MSLGKKILRTGSLAVVVSLGLTPSGVWGRSLESQFETFLSWWPGTYDNSPQIEAGSENRGVRLVISNVDVPAFGDHVVYAEWQDLNDPSQVIRQRFYSFEIDEARQALRLNLHIFPPDEDFKARTKGAYDDPARVETLTPADMVGLKGCDVFFMPTDGNFAGTMDRGACAFPVPTDDGPVDIYSWSQMKRTENTFEYLDGWFNLDDSYYMRMSEDWYVFIRQ
jgi:hypothetical protein